MQSIDQQLVSNDNISTSILSSLLTLQSLLQSSQQSNLPNISQIKIRITQIVEKLLSLTNSSEENQIRQSIRESSNDDSLTHCLWLIQKGIQLSRQMSSTSQSNIIPRVIIDSVATNSDHPGIGFRPRSPPLNEMRLMPSNSRSQNYISWFPSITANHSVPIDFRLQCWHQNQIPNIKDSTANIVAAKVRIHNDASVDISRDGQLLVCLVPNAVNSLNLSLYSLSSSSFGHLLCQWSFGSNAISVNLKKKLSNIY